MFNSDLEFSADVCHSYPRDLRDEKKLKREERRLKKQVGSLTSVKFPIYQIRLGTAEDMDKFSRRTVKVTREHNEECRRLLKLMGIPVVVVRKFIKYCINGS